MPCATTFAIPDKAVHCSCFGAILFLPVEPMEVKGHGVVGAPVSSRSALGQGVPYRMLGTAFDHGSGECHP
ncbi:protein of unknown function [Candidatus Nitrospira inopinata]|uniref:Uncharacterized protein n=1 Tax=Candidatus Nitrospira inopinata TaxID=1715989 RepID=A0A0S4L0D1_9BACT|nr:protein of unknown function [Candidatus Nitrospira inopinata]